MDSNYLYALLYLVNSASLAVVGIIFEHAFGIALAFAAAIGAACSLPGYPYRRVVYFFSSLWGSAFCAIILMNIIMVLANERGKRETEDMYEWLVTCASLLAGFIAAVFDKSQLQEQKMLATRSNRLLIAGWIALALISVLTPYFYGLWVTGYGKAFFPSTVAPFVSSIVIFIGLAAGLSLKVNIRTDHVFRRLFLYWPFATLFIMLICDTNRFAGVEIVQIVVWYAFLIGYPLSAGVFTYRRLKPKPPPPTP